MKYLLLIFIFGLISSEAKDIYTDFNKPRPTMVEERLRAYGIGGRPKEPELISKRVETQPSQTVASKPIKTPKSTEVLTPKTGDNYCVEAPSLTDAYTKAEEHYGEQIVDGTTRVTDIDGSVSSSNTVILNKTFALVKQWDGKYCFSQKGRSNIIADNKVETKPVDNTVRKPVRVFTEDYEDYVNTNVMKFASKSFVKAYARSFMPHATFEPNGEEYEEFLKTVDELAPNSGKTKGWFTKYPNLESVHIGNEEEFYTTKMWDFKGAYGHRGRLYELPNTLRVYMIVSFTKYDGSVEKKMTMVYGDGFFAKNIRVTPTRNSLEVVSISVEFSTGKPKSLTMPSSVSKYGEHSAGATRAFEDKYAFNIRGSNYMSQTDMYKWLDSVFAWERSIKQSL